MLLLLHVPYALLLGLWTTVAAIIPVIGSYFAAFPAIIVALFVSPTTAIFVAITYFAINMIDGNLIAPRVQGKALDVPPLKTGAIESPSPYSPLGSKGMGEGGGGGIHCICSAIQDALKPAGAAIVYDSCNPYHRVWSMLQDPETTRANVTVSP